MSAEDNGLSDLFPPGLNVDRQSASVIQIDTGKHALANVMCGIACGVSVVASVILWNAYRDNSMELRLLQQHVMSLEAQMEARKP
jgi:hypothetical protein